jgi:type I restriction-modification system DNA methylase subunit
MINDTANITNKDALKDKIHDIHNYLRNNGGGYGMSALKVFNLVYGLKKIEENGLLAKVGLEGHPECTFSHLLAMAERGEDEALAEVILHKTLPSVFRSSIKNMIFYKIPEGLKGSVFAYLIKEIDKITAIERTCNVLLSGKIYEYFIGRDESAISELGAYFTDRHIVEYIYDKLNPSLNEDGSVPSMIDMFGGSGGFTTGYINHMKTKYPALIAWEKEIGKVYHYDMNEDVIKSAGLEFFCLTGVLPDMDNLKYKNSFTDEFADDRGAPKLYKYVITNPPYGGDKTNKSDAQAKREKVADFIKKQLLTITDPAIIELRKAQLKKLDALGKQEKADGDRSKVSVPMCSGRIQKFAKTHVFSDSYDGYRISRRNVHRSS